MFQTSPSYQYNIDLSDIRLPLDFFISKSEASNVICPICKLSFKSPIFDQCGHIFCSHCSQSLFTSDTLCQCPLNNNNTIYLNKVYKCSLISNVLNALMIYCPNNCEWKGQFSELFTHITKSCKKQIIKCIYSSNGCDVMQSREEIQSKHIYECIYREIQCRNNCGCRDKILFMNEDEHMKICPNELIHCPQLCGRRVMRKNIDEHYKNECVNTLFPCLYQEFGCEEKVLKSKLNEHLDTSFDEHNNMIIVYMSKFYKEYEERTKAIEAIEKESEEKIKKINIMIEKIKKVNNVKISENNVLIYDKMLGNKLQRKIIEESVEDDDDF